MAANLPETDNGDMFDQLIENMNASSRKCTKNEDARCFTALADILRGAKQLYDQAPEVE